MKIINQLIDFLEQEGLVSDEDLQVLADRGFIDRTGRLARRYEDGDEYEYEYESRDDYDWEYDSQVEEVRQQHERLTATRRAGRGKRKRDKGSVEDLCAALQDAWDACKPKLVVLSSISDRLNVPCASIEESVLAVRNADARDLQQAVAALLREQKHFLRDFWQVVNQVAYREKALLCGDQQREAYRKLITAIDTPPVAGASRLLQFPEVTRVVNLAIAQRALLRSLAAVWTEQPALVDRSVSRNFDSVGYSALVLIYTAHALVAANGPDWPSAGARLSLPLDMPVGRTDQPQSLHALGLHSPQREMASGEDLALACAHASVMEPGILGFYLLGEPALVVDSDSTLRQADSRLHPSQGLTCPPAWDWGYQRSVHAVLPRPVVEQIQLELIPAGAFVMGSPKSWLRETQHRATISQAFWLGKYPVTQLEWESVMGTKPSFCTEAGANAPVEMVSWEDAQVFCAALNASTSGRRPSGYVYRLPTESEWEYACRAGTTSALNSGKRLTGYWGPCSNLDALAWYSKNGGGSTHPVGQKDANAWGLHDMHGNVKEWCHDWYDDYPKGSVTDPLGAGGWCRVRRGGSWTEDPGHCLASYRDGGAPGSRNKDVGFRLALALGLER